MEIDADEIRRVLVVGADAADLGGGEDDVVGGFVSEEGVRCVGARQIQVGFVAVAEVLEAGRFQAAMDGGAYQAGVAG